MTLRAAGVLAVTVASSAGAGCSLLSDTSGFACGSGEICGDDAAVPDPTGQPSDGGNAVPDASATSDGGDGGVTIVLPKEVARWRFEEGAGSTAFDSSGNGNTGTIKNGAPWSTGKFGGGLDFDGISQHVVVASSASLERTFTEVSLTAWVFRRARQGGFRAVLQRSAGTVTEDLLFFGFRDNAYYAKLMTTPGISTSLTGGSPPTDTWIHLAFTYDGASARLYANGDLVASNGLTGTVVADTTPLAIGTGYNSGVLDPTEAVDAIIDDVRIYDSALDAKQVAGVASGQ